MTEGVTSLNLGNIFYGDNKLGNGLVNLTVAKVGAVEFLYTCKSCGKRFKGYVPKDLAAFKIEQGKDKEADNILKPFLMGKGASVPMLVIFLGALGGFMAFGFIGLFLGSIVLSLSYKLYLTWVTPETA